MPAKAFFDTNILLYAYDRDAGQKREIARHLVASALSDPGSYAISVQVLQEFFVNFTRAGHADREAARLIDDFRHWTIIANTYDLFCRGLQVRARWQLSLWDSMVVAAAQAAGAEVLYTEDLNHGQSFGAVQVCNPFFETGE